MLGWWPLGTVSAPVRADAQRRPSDTADQAAARHAYPVATAPATGANSPATGTIVPSLPATMVGAKMLTSATAPQMPSTATGRPHPAIRSRAGKAAPNMTKPVATAPQIQIVIATMGTWSWLSEIRSGANTLLSAMDSHRPATATAAGSIRPVRWARWESWVLCVTTSVAVMRSPPIFECAGERHVVATPRRAPSLLVGHAAPLAGRADRPSLCSPSAGGLGVLSRVVLEVGTRDKPKRRRTGRMRLRDR